MTITFKTLGCKVNQYETQLMREQFASIGWEEAKERGDVYLINTCSVTATADRKSRHLINNALKLNPKPIVVAVGCGVENQFSGIKDIKDIDLRIANKDRQKIVPIIQQKFSYPQPQTDFRQTISFFKNHNRAFVKVQDGCNNFCSFCIIPYLRGKSRSRDLEQIIIEAERLADNGFQEIILCGVQLGAYGKDTGNSLVKLIENLEKIPGIRRIRLSSLNPRNIGEDLICKFRDSEKLCHHLHLSLQSGDDTVLKRMNRSYTRKEFLNLTERIKKIDRLFSFTTDVLTGFPGEGEKEFLNTVQLMRKVDFARTHIFSYSPRKGTKAANFLDELPSAELNRRAEILKQISAESGYKYRRRFLNQKVDVLVEGKKDEKGYFKGYTEHYVKVFLKENRDLKNKIISAKIKKVELSKTFGELKK